MRFLYKKATILLVAVIVIFLLSLNAGRAKYQFPLMEGLVTSVLAPVEYVVSRISFGIRHIGVSTSDMFTVYRDNQTLKTENAQLRQTNLDVAEIMAENIRLQSLLDYKKRATQFDLVVASVVARDPGYWTNIIIINRGSADGIQKDMPVVTAQGLVGNVTNVYNNTAKVQLILDPRSAVGALVQRPESRIAAIVEGSPSNPLTPRMVNIARDADIVKGDQIITSGFGGIYPKGLLVGEVVDIVNEEGGLLKYAVLKPAVDFDKLEEVCVIVRSREPAPTPLLPAVPPSAPAPPGQGGKR